MDTLPGALPRRDAAASDAGRPVATGGPSLPSCLRLALILLLAVAASACQTVTVEMVRDNLYVSAPEGPGPFPVVIYYQATGGGNRFGSLWAAWFKSIGVASAMVDNAKIRGRAGNPTGSMYTEDAALAWDILAADPRIDARRFALMGFSRGGQQALEAAPHFTGRRPAPDFVFALYPGGWGIDRCYSSHPRTTAVHIFFGDRDDIESYDGVATACRRLAHVGPGIDFHELRGATHAYDDVFASTFYCCGGRPVQVEPNPAAVEETRAIIEKAIRTRWNR
jgi:dienelactone hydrolase